MVQTPIGPSDSNMSLKNWLWKDKFSCPKGQSKKRKRERGFAGQHPERPRLGRQRRRKFDFDVLGFGRGAKVGKEESLLRWGKHGREGFGLTSQRTKWR